MSTDLAFLALDAAADRVASDDKLTELRAKLREFVAAKQLVDTIEGQLKEAQAAFNALALEIVPAKLDELGYSELKLSTGEVIRLRPFVSAKDTDEGRAWLEEHGAGELVKSTITIDVGKDEVARRNITRLLNVQAIGFEEKTGVAVNTLKAFIKKEIEAVRDVPLHLFNAYVGRIAEIKTTK